LGGRAWTVVGSGERAARLPGIQGMRPRARLTLALTLLASLGAVFSATAYGAEYSVVVCSQTATADGVTVFDDPSGIDVGFAVGIDCGNASGVGGITQQPVGPSSAGGIRWRLTAPADTTISTVDAQLGIGSPWDSNIVWEVRSGTGALLDLVESTVMSRRVHYTVDSSTMTAQMGCTAINACTPAFGPTFTASARLSSIVATLKDDSPPTVSLGALPSDPVHGTIQVPYSASDRGSGIASVTLIVDGTPQPAFIDENGGKCGGRKPYVFLVPCKLDLSTPLSLNTVSFPDGQHEIKIAVVDAAGQRSESAPLTITTHNAPVSSSRPVLSGQATLGQRLTATSGGWEGERPSFAYQWLRCQPGVKLGEEAGCTPLDGATLSRYTPVAADVGQRDVVRVTASNRFGRASALSAPSDPVAGAKDVTPPLLTGVSLSRRRFKLGKGGTAAKGARGIQLRLSTSEAGTLSIAIAPARGGKKVAKPLATLKRSIAAGPAHIALSGRIGGKPLPPGRYRLTATESDAPGNTSKPASLSFTVLPG
jgi:hypothetical protein